MRDLNFRAWHKGDSMIPAHMAYDKDDLGRFFQVYDGWDIMQYTGLKDKNGVLIYEGDVLLIADTYTDRILDDGTGPREPFNHLSAVSFDSLGGFGVDIKEHGDIFNCRFWSFLDIVRETGEAQFEVIGSIYENPELIIAGA